MNWCEACQKQENGTYCSHCGRPLALERIDGSYVLEELKGILNFEKGYLYTVKELLIRPKQNIHDFLLVDRNRIVKPVLFLFFCTLIYTVIEQLTNLEFGYIKFQGDQVTKTATAKIFEWTQSNYGYANIFIAVFISFWATLLFRKYNYNLFEILVLISFILGVNMLIYSLFGMIIIVTGLNLMSLAAFIALIYSTWAIGSFFDDRKVKNYLKAIASFLLGFLSFALGALVLGKVLDLLF